MKTGKMSQNILRRSVIKNISSDDNNVLAGPEYGRDYAKVLVDSGSLVTSTQTVIDKYNLLEKSVKCALERALNNLWLSDAKPFGVEIALTLSDRVSEKKLSEAMVCMNDICQSYGVTILGGNTIVSDEISRSVISVSAMGYSISTNSLTKPNKKKISGMGIIVAGNLAAEECTKVTMSRHEELSTRLADWLLDSVVNIGEELSIKKIADVVRDRCEYMHDISSGGIFTALWEMGEYLDCGMEIDMHKIPMRQEIIEVCEFFELNPYEMDSAGCLLIVASDCENVVASLHEEGIRVAQIGFITDSKARVILSGEEQRFLDRA